MEDIEKIIGILDKFMDKKKCSTQDKFNITKIMNDNYWEDIRGEGEEDLEDDDVIDDDDVSEEGGYDEEEDLGEVKSKKLKIKNNKIPIKGKPKINGKPDEDELLDDDE